MGHRGGRVRGKKGRAEQSGSRRRVVSQQSRASAAQESGLPAGADTCLLAPEPA